MSNSISQILKTEHRIAIREVLTILRNADRVVVAAHEHPDGDAVGSILALTHVLKLQGKIVTAFTPDPVPEALQFLPGIGELTTQKPNPEEYDVLVVLDCTRTRRAHLEAEVKSHPNSVVIDHHEGNPGEGHWSIVVPEAAATTQILAEMFRLENIKITKDIATCLLTGLFTDTGSFTHDSTTPEILETAAWLMSHGARLSHIAHETYQKKDVASLRIWGRALSRVTVSPETGASVAVVTRKDLEECSATLEDLSGVVNMLNTLPGSKFAMLLCEYEPGKIKGSLRSEPSKNTDVSQIAQKLGGGGHKLAAGFTVDGHLVQQNNQWRVVN